MDVQILHLPPQKKIQQKKEDQMNAVARFLSLNKVTQLLRILVFCAYCAAEGGDQMNDNSVFVCMIRSHLRIAERESGGARVKYT